MKKKIIIGIIVVLILVLGYFGYKGFLLNHYKVDISEKEYKFSEDIINIKTIDITDEETIEFENIIYPNILDNFVLDETNSGSDGMGLYNTYNLKDDSGKLRAMFKVGSRDYDYYEIFISDQITTYGVDLKNLNRKDLLEKFNIKNNIELIKYIINHYEDSVNIFSSSDEIKMNYFIKTFTDIVIPVYKISFIEGDINGIMHTITDNAFYEVHLHNNNEKYFLTFASGTNEEYFTIDYIKEFLTKIHFK